MISDSHMNESLNALLGAAVPAIVLIVAIVVLVARSTFDNYRVYSRGHRIGEQSFPDRSIGGSHQVDEFRLS
jgi:hypothetical protein